LGEYIGFLVVDVSSDLVDDWQMFIQPVLITLLGGHVGFPGHYKQNRATELKQDDRTSIKPKKCNAAITPSCGF